ncbi:conserved hypothetical protein [Ricinus communis]|uniref:Uncharacterized protein n=1 Tax=Ricinus communis TaxID=3988 RepID=B9TGM3_RICCO|nr:conserved hypothetical protein [Ricinus communis]
MDARRVSRARMTGNSPSNYACPKRSADPVVEPIRSSCSPRGMRPVFMARSVCWRPAPRFASRRVSRRHRRLQPGPDGWPVRAERAYARPFAGRRTRRRRRTGSQNRMVLPVHEDGKARHRERRRARRGWRDERVVTQFATS